MLCDCLFLKYFDKKKNIKYLFILLCKSFYYFLSKICHFRFLSSVFISRFIYFKTLVVIF